MNKDLFQTSRGPTTDAINNAGGGAYARSPEAELAQLACTGTFHNTFYTKADTQIERVKELLQKVDVEFHARLAVYSKKSAGMKDMSVFLLASLFFRDSKLFEQAAPFVLTNGKMVRNFVQIFRSGSVGKGKSIPRPVRRFLVSWLQNRGAQKLLNDSVGTSPSIGDVIKMVHPSPKDEEMARMFAYLVGKDRTLPKAVQDLASFQEGNSEIPPKVEFRLLTGKPLTKDQWTTIALNMPWHALRINLNTFGRHGVYENISVVRRLAEKLRDRESILRSNVFPYQIMTAFKNTVQVPPLLLEALQDAMEIACENVPVYEGNIIVGVDTSGSMSSPVTGYQGSVSSKTSCVDVAALIASCILRKNPGTKVIPFDTKDHSKKVRLNPRDSIMTNADKLCKLGGGGTNCGIPFETVNHGKDPVDLFILVSDNESWVNTSDSPFHRIRSTSAMEQWSLVKKRCPNAKLICININPYGTSQVKASKDIFEVGGFSDQVFRFIDSVVSGNPDKWIKQIQQVSLLGA